MNTEMSVGLERQDGWACCLSLLLGGRRVNGFHLLLKTMIRYLLFRLQLQSQRMNHFTTRHWYHLYLQCSLCFQCRKTKHVFSLKSHTVVRLHSLQTLLGIRSLLAPLFLSSICTPLWVHVTQFVFSSSSTESREMVQSRSTQRNYSSTVSLFAEMAFPVTVLYVRVAHLTFFARWI